MRVGCGFFLSAVKFLRGGLKKVCKKFRKSIAVLNLLVIFANEIKTQRKMKTNYFIDYRIYKNANGTIEATAYELHRRNDDAILASHTELNDVLMHCWKNGIAYNDVVIL